MNKLMRNAAGLVGPRSLLGRNLVAGSHAGRKTLRNWLRPVAVPFAYGRLLAWALLRAGFAVVCVPLVLALLRSAPGADYMLGRAMDFTPASFAQWRHWGFVLLSVVLWVITSWFWSSIALVSAKTVPDAPPLCQDAQAAWVQGLKNRLPAVIAAAAAFAVAWGFVAITLEPRPLDGPLAQQFTTGYAVLRGSAGAVLVASLCGVALAAWVGEILGRSWRHQADGAAVILLWRWLVFAVGTSILIWLLVAATVNPVLASTNLGGALNLLLWAAMAWIGLGTTLILLGDAWEVPLIAFVAVWFAVAATISTQHSFSIASPPMRRPALELAWQKWLGRNPQGSEPLVLVAAAGGGMRAAYWTATVLGAAADSVHGPGAGFLPSVFAISSVSGGSLGAAVYAGLTAHGLAACRVKPPLPPRGYASCGQQVLATDLLGPTVAGAVFTDVLQNAVPTTLHRFPDRAAALERAIAKSWQKAMGDANPFARPLDQLYAANRAAPVPELLLNGTSVHTGERVITASAALPAELFHDAIDPIAMFQIGPTLSQAVMNSARFPYVTPVAGVGTGTARDEIADGGYFENFGAGTLEELLGWLKSRAGAHPIIVLSISADDTLPAEAAFEETRCTAAPPPPDPLGSLLPQLDAPALALLNGRSAHGELAAWHLKAATEAAHGRFIAFRLTRAPGESGVPLSWYLSDAGRMSIRVALAGCPNSAAMAALAAAFNPKPPGTPAP